MINLKPYFDAVQQAEAHVQELAQQIDGLFNSGKTDEAMGLKAELDQAKSKAKSANDLYMTMRDAGLPESETARKFTAVNERDLHLGLTNREKGQYSLLRAIEASITKDWSRAGFEAEVSNALAAKLGRQPSGFFMPLDLQIARPQNTQQVGDPQYGGYLKATELSADFIDVLRNRMVLRAAGARVLAGLVGDIDIPKKTTASSAYWIGEGNSPTKSTLVFGQVQGRPRTVAGYLQLTRRFLKQSSMDVEMMARDDLASTLALEMDRVGFHGLGASNEPLGLQYLTGIGSVAGGTNGAAPTFGNVVGLETEVAVDNADIGSTAYITNAKVRGKLKVTETASGNGIFVWQNGSTPLNGYPAYVTNQISSTLTKGNQSLSSAIFFGNWADMVYLFWGGLDVLVDPYTNSTSGDVLITAMQDCDLIFRRAQSFAAMLDALTA